MVRRFRLIDGEFRRLAPEYTRTLSLSIVIVWNFTTRTGLVEIIRTSGLPMFHKSRIVTIERRLNERTLATVVKPIDHAD